MTKRKQLRKWARMGLSLILALMWPLTGAALAATADEPATASGEAAAGAAEATDEPATASEEAAAGAAEATDGSAEAAGETAAGAADEPATASEEAAGAAHGPQEAFMQAALEEAYAGIEAGDGGPFGTVIVKDGEIVGRGHNRVVVNQDPTCHGEMEAIRDACKNLGTFDLSGCELYTTAEPCPMCLGATLLANIPVVYYGCTREDSDGIGFRDEVFYEYLAGENDLLTVSEFERESCLELFEAYTEIEGKTAY